MNISQDVKKLLIQRCSELNPIKFRNEFEVSLMRILQLILQLNWSKIMKNKSVINYEATNIYFGKTFGVIYF